MYPINIKATPEFIEQLIECETGRQEDNPNQTTFCDFGDRHNDTIECRNSEGEVFISHNSIGQGS